MTSLLQKLNAAARDAFKAAGLEGRHALVVPSARPDLCQFQCNGVMAAAKEARARGDRMDPQAFAQHIAARLTSGEPLLARAEVAGPGFINLTCRDAALADMARAASADRARFGVPPSGPGPVVLDFGGPNVAKPLHVGHLRSALLGDCLCRLHRFLAGDGGTVVSDIHLGDWGTQMGMLIEAVREEQPGLPYFDPDRAGGYPAASPVGLDDLERMYPAMSARCAADEELVRRAREATRELQSGRPGYRALWRHFVDVSIAAMKADFSALGVGWDLWLGESDSQAAIPLMLEDLRARGVSAVSEGATVINLDPIANAQTPPLLLVKSDGGYLYGTTDLATLKERVERWRPARILYVADRRQSLHFAQVFQGAAKAGYLGGARPEHVAFGTVNGKDGKPFKTREGGVMRLGRMLFEAVEKAGQRLADNGMADGLAPAERAGLARQVALAAVKFADLANPRAGDYVFDLDKFTLFEGRTGPYLLYAAVRMKGILRKAAERGLAPGALGDPGDAERPLFLAILALPEVLERASQESAPHHLCDWAYDLAGRFSVFYQGASILREEDPGRQAAWLGLTRACLDGLERVLGLLGIEVPERM